MKSMKKTIAALVAIAMIFGCVVGGTIAWLIDKDDAVVNTFTSSDVDIELTENTGDTYKMVPGATITKDPKVTVLADSEECYLFVEIVESTNYDDYLLDYAVTDVWTLLNTSTDGLTKVYYRVVSEDDAKSGKEYQVLSNNEVKVSTEVTKTQMDNLNSNNYPTLTFTAYAIQHDYLTDKTGEEPADALYAWGLAKAQANN